MAGTSGQETIGGTKYEWVINGDGTKIYWVPTFFGQGFFATKKFIMEEFS